MNEQEKIEGNQLIAEFDDNMKLDETDPKSESWNRKPNSEWHHSRSVKYHSSWDWLMPPIIKFMNIKGLKGSLLGKYDYWCEKINDAICTYDIVFACKTLANAIKWYNQQNKTP